MNVTSNATYRTLQYQLSTTSTRLNELYIQSSNGKEVTKPSDEPTAVSDILGTRSQIEHTERLIENCKQTQDALTLSETYLDAIEDLMVRAKEIATAGGNGSLGQADLDSYADEVAQLKQQLLDLGNAQVEGTYLFAGYNDQTPPFSGSPVTYNGTGDLKRIEVSAGTTLAANIPGDVLLMAPVDLFASLDDLETNLRAGDPAIIASQLDSLEAGADQVRSQQSTLGQNAARLEDLIALQEKIVLDQQEALSRWEDADLTEVLSEISKAELALEATMQVTSRVTNLRLMDYL